MNYALQFVRIDGRRHDAAYSTVPADESPAQELRTFLRVMRREVGAAVARMSRGRYAVHLAEAGQIWAVQIVLRPELDDTQPMPAVVVYDERQAAYLRSVEERKAHGPYGYWDVEAQI